ncbi:MAG: hypothetical protein GX267_10765 [Fibrobacter sp.]|nr:hypothetical protein [Fibrobacter sp.]
MQKHTNKKPLSVIHRQGLFTIVIDESPYGVHRTTTLTTTTVDVMDFFISG